MNQKALSTLEYTKIIAQLEEYASTSMGKKRCRELVPMNDLQEIKTTQAQTSDALARILRKGSISFSGAKDIRDSLLRLKVGSSLSIAELLRVSALLRVALRASDYGKRDHEPGEEDDALDAMFRELAPVVSLAKEIDRCILSEEEIADDASNGLRSVRRAMKTAAEKIRTQLNSLVVNSRTYLQDGVITMRNGRYCVPVKAEHKSNVPGMVHDQSSSGSTIFVEPLSVVKLNNELRELEIREQKEIEAVLAALSNQTCDHLDELTLDLELIGELDFIFAKATLSRHYRGCEPRLNKDGIIRLKNARHPLLDPHRVVPITLTLGENFDLLIVTGPNTGGKTVSLKTVGLLTLMGLAGLHVPAAEGTTLSVFTEVYADIGDEQSIEQNLSTFSSHMTNTVKFLDKADKDSLVLFDELGAGTDPVEGAALAMAILSFLHNMKVRTMATTHYSELKLFALSTPGVENASCEFNVETLRPTYRLLVGIPGKSNAFAISRKLGLPEFIIDDAKKHIDSQDESFEDVISNLEASRVQMEQDKEQIAAYKDEMESLKKQLSAQKEKLEQQKAKILQDANEKARKVLQDAKDYADETIRIINKKTDGGEVSRLLEEERTKLRTKLDKTASKAQISQPKASPSKKPDAKKLKLGDAVKVVSLNLRGIVSSLPNARGDLFVQMGILRSQVNINDLELIDEQTISGDGVPAMRTKQKGNGSGKIRMSKSATVSPEINLIGKTVDEAIPELDKYLDDAYLAHLEKVRVVHGRGTGALRNGVHQHLRKLKYVKSFHLGEFGEGDSGVTIVTFK